MGLGINDVLTAARQQIISQWKHAEGYASVYEHPSVDKHGNEYIALLCTTHDGEEEHRSLDEIPLNEDSEGYVYIEALASKVSAEKLREFLNGRRWSIVDY